MGESRQGVGRENGLSARGWEKGSLGKVGVLRLRLD